MTDENTTVQKEFRALVNIPSAHLRKWLGSQESRRVGMTSSGEKITGAGAHESVGHHMGERILSLLDKKSGDLSDDDIGAMHKVIGYIHRHTAQRPAGDITDTRRRKSLMNWGHDPK